MQAGFTGPTFTRIYTASPSNGYAEKFKHVISPSFNIARTTHFEDFARVIQTDGIDFLPSGTKPFRPAGIAVSPDGLSFYIADWNYDGWKANVVAGRLLKVTYTGRSLAAHSLLELRHLVRTP